MNRSSDYISNVHDSNVDSYNTKHFNFYYQYLSPSSSANVGGMRQGGMEFHSS